MPRILKNLITASGNAGTSGQTFKNHVAGTPVSGTKMSDYNITAFAFNAALTTYIPNAWQAPRGTPSAVDAGYSANVTFAYTPNVKGPSLFAISGLGEIVRLDVDKVTHIGRIVVTLVSRSSNTVTYSVLFKGVQGTLNSVAGATSSVPSPLLETDELYKARWTMTPNTTAGAQGDLGFGFRGKPDSATGVGYNDELFEGAQWYLTVNGAALVDADLEFAWTSNNLSPLAGGTVVSTAKVFTTANGTYVSPGVSSEFHNVIRYGWCRLVDPVGSWVATGAKTFIDPRM